MKHVLLPPFFAVAALVSCDPVLAQQIPQPQPSPEGVYLNTERGLRVRPLEGREISPSLIKGLKPEEQITKRTPGVPTKPSILLSTFPARPSPALSFLRPSPSR